MKNIISIAKNTFKETLRDKIIYGIVGFAFLFLLSIIFISSLSLGEDLKVTKDLGLAGIYIFTLIITIFLGSSMIYKELEKRTIYIILSKPVGTIEFILGKFLGLLSSIGLNVLLMTIIYLFIVAYQGGGIDFTSLLSVMLLLFEVSIIISLTLLFSTFTTPLATTIYSIIFLYIGHSLSLLIEAANKSNILLEKIPAYLIYYIFPNLEKFNIRDEVVYGIIPNATEIVFPIVYSICFTAIFIWLTNLALKKQDL